MVLTPERPRLSQPLLAVAPASLLGAAFADSVGKALCKPSKRGFLRASVHRAG